MPLRRMPTPTGWELPVSGISVRCVLAMRRRKTKCALSGRNSCRSPHELGKPTVTRPGRRGTDEELAAFLATVHNEANIFDDEPDFDVSDDDYDEKYQAALEFVLASRQASISGVQRALRVGYNRAARIIDLMEKQGIVGPSDGVKPRQVLIDRMY